MKWFVDLLKGIWQGIKKGCNWISSKIKNIFSSKKNHSTDPEKGKTEEKNQQRIYKRKLL